MIPTTCPRAWRPRASRRHADCGRAVTIPERMNVDDRLLHETRVRMRWAVIAVAAGLLLLSPAALARAGPRPTVNEETVGLVDIHRGFPSDVVAAVINGL